MRQAVLLTVFALVGPVAATADVVRHDSIPEPYRGTWAGTAGAESEKSVIVLSARRYVSREVSCSVEWVSQTPGARGSIYSAHLQCVDPAEKAGKKTVSNLIIRPDSTNQIAVGREFMSLKVFRRCSAAPRGRSDRLLSEDTDSDESGVGSGTECRTDEGDVNSSSR